MSSTPPGKRALTHRVDNTKMMSSTARRREKEARESALERGNSSSFTLFDAIGDEMKLARVRKSRAEAAQVASGGSAWSSGHRRSGSSSKSAASLRDIQEREAKLQVDSRVSNAGEWLVLPLYLNSHSLPMTLPFVIKTMN